MISDLHIAGAQDPIYRRFLAFLRTQTHPGDTVVFLGDIFDLFVGNKPIFLQEYHEFFQLIASLGRNSGIEFHYLEGNHDFLLEAVFVQWSFFHSHTADFSLEIAEKKFYFTHGDEVNRQDYGYLFLRWLLRSWMARLLVRCLPGAWLDACGKSWSRLSRSHSSPARSLERTAGLRKLYRSFAAERLAQGFDFVVAGHCHDLDEMFFLIGERVGQYINVGFPRLHGSFLSWAPGEGKIQREKLAD